MSATGPFTVTHRISDEQRQRDASRLEADGHKGEAFQLLVAPPAVLYREAFATLEDRNRAVCVRILNAVPIEAQPDLYAQVTALGESGGTIPLPDGSVIKVEATTYGRLLRDLGLLCGAPNDTDLQRLAAWNAEHGIGLEARA